MELLELELPLDVSLLLLDSDWLLDVLPELAELDGLDDSLDREELSVELLLLLLDAVLLSDWLLLDAEIELELLLLLVELVDDNELVELLELVPVELLDCSKSQSKHVRTNTVMRAKPLGFHSGRLADRIVGKSRKKFWPPPSTKSMLANAAKSCFL